MIIDGARDGLAPDEDGVLVVMLHSNQLRKDRFEHVVDQVVVCTSNTKGGLH